MRIVTALATVRRLYIDTAPLIYFVEVHPTYISKMDAIIRLVEDHAIRLFSSVITLTEILNQPIKHGNAILEAEYRDILVNNDNYELVPTTLAIAERAARLRAQYNLRTPDALYVASAIHAGCDAFLTNDNGIRRVHELNILLLDDLDQ